MVLLIQHHQFNPHQEHWTYMINTLVAPFTCAYRHRELLTQLIRRDVNDKYKGTALGVIWAFINPLLMLAIYTAVFKFIFKARWPETDDSTSEFALMLFIGLLVHGLAADVISRSANIISSNRNYVKKVVFPLHILSWSLIVSSLIQFFFGLLILLVKSIHLSGLLLPIVLLPYLLFLLGFSWAISALSVFFKDINQITPSFITILLFTSTVFFPFSHAPELIQPLLAFNPLTLIIESCREILFYGKPPNFSSLSIYFSVSLGFCLLGYTVFKRLERGFSDAI
jgi:lipopolysaccharide transport system permease protein